MATKQPASKKPAKKPLAHPDKFISEPGDVVITPPKKGKG